MVGPAKREKQKRGRRSVAAATPGGPAAALASTIDELIVPQLVVAQASDPALSSLIDARTPPTDEEVQKLASIVLDGELDAARAFVESLIQEGLSPQSALLLLVAPAARVLQAEWLAEDCSFEEIASALKLIHQLVSALAEWPRPAQGPSPAAGG